MNSEIKRFLIYLTVMAGVTFLVRMLPVVLFRKKIKNKFLNSLFYYIPYAVLAAMTIPDIFYSTGSYASALAGLAVAVVLALFNRGLITVAVGASTGVLVAALIINAFTVN